MAAIPFGLSIHHFISTVGADAGFAAIIGLAILVLLFFAQARETSALRRRADEAEGQLESLQMYVQQLSRTRQPPPAPGTAAPVTPAPAAARVTPRPAVAAAPAAPRPSVAPAPAAARAVAAAPVAAGAVATIPEAPAGVGAPALSAATRLIPDADPISIRALRPSSNGQAAGEDRHGESGAAAVAAPPSPPPSTAAAGANGSAGRAPVAAPASVEARRADDDISPPPRVSLRPQGAPPSRPAAPPPRRPADSGGRRPNRLVIALAAALVLAVVVVGAILLTGSGGGTAAQSTSTSRASQTGAGRQTSKHHRPRAGTNAAATVAPASVTVAVLNGTSTSHLASDVMAKLTAAGYKQGGAPTNAPSQTLTSTIVGYTQPAYRNDAMAVARSLSLGPASVQGVNPNDHATACSATPTSCPTQVVVTVGSDLSSAG